MSVRRKKKKFTGWFFALLFFIALIVVFQKFIDTPQPGEISFKITENNNPKEYTGFITQAYNTIFTGELILVNNNTAYHPDQNQVEQVSVFDRKTDDYKVANKDILLRNEIIGPFNNMLNAYRQKTKITDVIVVSGYRSPESQEALYNEEKQANGEAQAKRAVAKPGFSEHHTGLAMDLGIFTDKGLSREFNGDNKQAWLINNACQYGFVVRYETSKEKITGIMNEPWHFRYVGIPHAKIMNQKNLCLEEYIDFLRKFEYGKKHLQADGYEIYFVKANTGFTKISVPKNKSYTVSGNNVDGFIVTVNA